MVAAGPAVASSRMVSWRHRLGQLSDDLDLPHGAADRLSALLELVRDDSHAPTTVGDPEKAVETHVADSLSALALPVVREARSVVDLGSGAGFPGLPLAVALPEVGVTLVESQSRKCAFLRRAVEAAGVANAVVACDRAETWPGRGVDLVVARAVAPLAVLAEYAAPLLEVGGSLVAWKGAPAREELEAARRAASLLGLDEPELVAVPARQGADRRTLCRLRKGRPTPDRFPRRPGMARKRPLGG